MKCFITKRTELVIIVLSILVSACNPAGSARDVDKEQKLEDSARRMRELQPLTGNYQGQISFFPVSAGIGLHNQVGLKVQHLKLHLSIAKTPSGKADDVDRLLLPTLEGSIDLIFGDADSEEYIRFVFDSADFNPDSREWVAIARQGELKLIARFENNHFVGKWSNAFNGEIGEFWISRDGNAPQTFKLVDHIKPRIGGKYTGTLIDNQGHVQNVDMQLLTIRDLAESVSADSGGLTFGIYGNFRLYFGEGTDSDDYLNFTIKKMHFDYRSLNFTLTSDDGDAVLDGKLENGQFVGQWTSLTNGNLGTVVFNHEDLSRSTLVADGNDEPEDEEDRTISSRTALSGVYNGTLQNTLNGRAMTLQVRIQSTRRTTLDVGFDSDKGFMLSGSVHIFPSSSREESAVYLFQNAFYNYVTHELILKSKNAAIILKGLLVDNQFNGRFETDVDGDVGAFATRLNGDFDGLLKNTTTPPVSNTYTGFVRDGNVLHSIAIKLVTLPLSSEEISMRGGGLSYDIRGNIKLFVGTNHAYEYVNFTIANAHYDDRSGTLNIQANDNDTILNGTLRDGRFIGSWESLNDGTFGSFDVVPQSQRNDDDDRVVDTALANTYSGVWNDRIIGQQKIIIHLNASRTTRNDSLSGNDIGFELSGSLSIFNQPHNSLEIAVYPFSSAYYNYRTHELSLKTANGTMLLNGILENDQFSGEMRSNVDGLLGSFDTAVDSSLFTVKASGDAPSIAGLYKGFVNQGTFGQWANLHITSISRYQAGSGTTYPEGIAFALKGSLKLFFGDDFEGDEYLNFTLQRATFDERKNELTLYANDDQTIIRGKLDQGRFHASWLSLRDGTFGDVTFIHEDLKEQVIATTAIKELGGRYIGHFAPRDDAPKQGFVVRINSVRQTTNMIGSGTDLGFSLSGTLSFYQDSYTSDAYVSYPFRDAYYNYVTRAFVIKSSAGGMIFKGQLKEQGIEATLHSDTYGEIGTVSVTKNAPFTFPKAIIPISGNYRGFIHEKEGPDHHLLIDLVIQRPANGASATADQATAFTIEGGLSIKQQDADAIAVPFRIKRSSFDIFTRALTLEGDDFIVTGHLEQGFFHGTWTTKGLGTFGTFSIERQL